MLLTGFTDEASSDLDIQIKITKELGWKYLSARTVGDANIHEISDVAFDRACDQFEASKIKVAEFGTLIGNWAKSIHSDFDITKREVERCIPRMKRLNVKFARIMSYAQEPWGSDQHEEERFRRLRWIVDQFAGAGLQALHENCMNWGGFSAEHTLRLLEEVPGLKLVFDTGNPIFQRDRSREGHPWQNGLEFYRKVKHAIVHVHVKDATMSQGSEEPTYTFPGEGSGHVEEVLSDLQSSGYKGFIAIEPHIGKVFHGDFEDADEDHQYRVYLEYGRRMESVISEITS